MFSGIGAIEYALKRLKISNEIVFASDNDKFVKESYYANYEYKSTVHVHVKV
jgi:DNA (cytosine-5)-methyltransferase 1